MTTQEYNQAKPIRSSVNSHSIMAGCDVRHKTNEAMDRCEDKDVVDTMTGETFAQWKAKHWEGHRLNQGRKA